MANARSVLADLLQLRESISYGQSASAGLTSVQLAGLDEILSQAWRVAQDVINASSPVNRLPPDLLAIVFALVPSPLTDVPDPPYGSGRMYRIQELRPITAVCRYWRDISLNTSSLWSTIIDTSRLYPNHNAAPMWPSYIHRCKTALLHIYLRMTPSVSTMEMVQRQHSRVKELWAQAIPLHIMDESSIAQLSFPELEHCSIKVASVLLKDPTPRTAPLFGSNLRLRTLILTNSLFIPSNYFPALTHLRLSYDSTVVTRSRGTLGDVVAFLSRAPRLRQVELENLAQYSMSPSLDGWQGGTLHLQSLDHFTSTETSDFAWPAGHPPLLLFRQALFGTLSFHANCVIEMGLFYGSDLGICADMLPVRRATHIRLTHTPDPKSNTDGFSVLLEASNPSKSERTLLRMRGPRHAGQARLVGGGIRLYLVPALASSPIFSSVRKVWFDTRMGMLFRSSIPILASLPRAEMVVVRQGNWYSPWAKNVLSTLEVQEKADGTTACALPALAVLLVDCKHSADLWYVHRVVDARARAGYPLQMFFVGSWEGQVYVVQEYQDGTLVRTGGEEIVQELWDEFCEPY